MSLLPSKQICMGTSIHKFKNQNVFFNHVNQQKVWRYMTFSMTGKVPYKSMVLKMFGQFFATLQNINYIIDFLNIFNISLANLLQKFFLTLSYTKSVFERICRCHILIPNSFNNSSWEAYVLALGSRAKVSPSLIASRSSLEGGLVTANGKPWCNKDCFKKTVIACDSESPRSSKSSVAEALSSLSNRMFVTTVLIQANIQHTTLTYKCKAFVFKMLFFSRNQTTI